MCVCVCVCVHLCVYLCVCLCVCVVFCFSFFFFFLLLSKDSFNPIVEGNSLFRIYCLRSFRLKDHAARISYFLAVDFRFAVLFDFIAAFVVVVFVVFTLF